MVRAIGLSLVFLLGLGAMIPISMNLSEASSKNRVTKRKKKKVKKYSKEWWRIYRARMKKKRALMARKRAFQMRRQDIASRASGAESRSRTVGGVNYVQTSSPLGDQTPNGWRNRSPKGGNVEFDVADENGQNIGTASLSVVGAAINVDDSTPPTVRNRTLGGVPTGSLRRTVIDKMLREDGWVVNDFQKEVNGKKVFVVVAQSGSNGAIKQQTYYFTEIDGRIYNLTTNSPVNLSERLDGDSEKVINALQRSRSGAAQTEATLR